MSELKVFNRHFNDAPESAVYVGRPTKFGNPYTVTEHGRGEAIRLFTQNELKRLYEPARQELKGKHLICWCAPPGGLPGPTETDTLACHEQILLWVASWEVNIEDLPATDTWGAFGMFLARLRSR